MTEQAMVRIGETLPAAARASKNPAAVYLASLRPTVRRPMASALRNVAELLGCDVEAMPWHELRSHHGHPRARVRRQPQGHFTRVKRIPVDTSCS